MTALRRRATLLALRAAPFLLFAFLLALFAGRSDRFLTPANFVNIVIQSAHTGIVAIGMTFVLLIGGIDLSVGANMFVCAAILGLFLQTWPLWLSLPLVMLIGLGFGMVNALFITQLRVTAFVTTLATLFIGRGLALYLTGNKLIPLGDAVLRVGRGAWLGVPSAIWALSVVLLAALLTLRETPFGRQIYAVGADAEAAAKAGIDVRRTVFVTYCVCGVCAAIGSLVSASQVAVASSTFGYQEEFPAIAAAVLGGTSLFGGRGGVLGTLFGAVLIQTVENGLVMSNADPYVYPLVISAIIFAAVFVDSTRASILERMQRRQIRPERA